MMAREPAALVADERQIAVIRKAAMGRTEESDERRPSHLSTNPCRLATRVA